MNGSFFQNQISIIKSFLFSFLFKTNPANFLNESKKGLRFVFLVPILYLSVSNSMVAKEKIRPKILVVMSAANTVLIDGYKNHPTGVFLGELYEPIQKLKKDGVDFVFATPGGKKATIDPESVKEKYWESTELKNEALQFVSSSSSFQNPIPLEQTIKEHKIYIGLLIPGGQGLMTDLLYDRDIPKILKLFHENQRPIGLVCHAPALLTTLNQNPNFGEFIFKGYKVNSVTKMEEWFIETFVMKGSPKVRNISTLLDQSGMVYESSFLPGRSYAIRDRNLITSQNPFSGFEFTELYAKAILEYSKKNSF